ncbi:MAG TPA: type II toxin-antitoxin system VapC family toxin [Acidobacteriaceae bacterium]|nr:type II toxin-antitoxin system VapC family toxin [Acidobacteriaceae bacterium]
MSLRTGYLLDTNVVSELRKARPNPAVLALITRMDSSQLYLSVLTLGEIRKGAAVRRQRDPAGADAISLWADGIEYGYGDRILAIDSNVARVWGELCADRSRPAVDTLIAATALVHQLTLVTRNISDIRGIDLPTLNPFSS